MVTEDILRVQPPCPSMLIGKDPVQDRIQNERAPRVVVLSFRLSASVVLGASDRYDTVFDVCPLETESFARSHSGTEEPAPQVDIPLVIEVVHEPSCLFRLQYLFADLRRVLWNLEK